jgi:hypothetical protein
MNVPGSARSSASPNKFGASGTMNYDPRLRQNNRLSKEIRIKLLILSYLDSKFVTILMSLVTVFALVGVSHF